MLALHRNEVCRSSCLATQHATCRPKVLASSRRLSPCPRPTDSSCHSTSSCSRTLPRLPLHVHGSEQRGAQMVVQARRSAAREELPADVLSPTITSYIMETENLQELEAVVTQWSGSFGPIQASAVFNKAAKHAGKQPQKAWPVARVAAKAWDRVLPRAEPRQLASTLWSAAKLQFVDEALWNDTLEAFMQQQSLRAANCMDLANIAYALGTIAQVNKGEVPGVPRADVLDALALIMDEAYVFATSPDPAAVNAQDLANLLWACAILRFNPGNVQLDALLQAYTRAEILEHAIPINISTVHHSVATLVTTCQYQPRTDGRPWRMLFVDEQVLRRLASDMSGRVSETAYNLIRLCCHTPSYITTQTARDSLSMLLSGRVTQKLLRWKLFDVSTALWAHALLDMQDDLSFVTAALDVLSSLQQKESLGRNSAHRLGVTHKWLVVNGLLGGYGLADVLTAQQLQQCAKAAKHNILRY